MRTLNFMTFLIKDFLLWGLSTIDTFQDFFIAEHIKPNMHLLEISILSLKCVVHRPTKTPKSADKKMAQFW